MSKNSHISRYKAICYNCFVRWNLTAAVAVSFTLFFVVLSYSIYEILCPQYPPQGNQYELFSNFLKDIKRQSDLAPWKEVYKEGICSIGGPCEIICFNKKVYEINDYIDLFNGINEDNKCPGGKIKLTLTSCIYENNILDYQWLGGLSSLQNIYITSLEINSNVNGIEERAFASTVFEKLQKLIIINANIEFLKKSAFAELQVLDTFAFRIDSGFTMIEFEENLFEFISQTLVSLQFAGIIFKPEMLQNITGMKVKDSLNNLSIFDLQANSINKIEKGSFIKAPNLISLYLAGSSLTVLDVDAFQGLNNIRILDLRNNNLCTFRENIFECLPKAPKNITIFNNPFRCDCNLEWFVEYYETSGYFSGTDFFCETTEGRVDYKEVHFCPSEASREPSMSTDFPEMTTSSSTSERTTTKWPTAMPTIKTSSAIRTTVTPSITSKPSTSSVSIQTTTTSSPSESLPVTESTEMPTTAETSSKSTTSELSSTITTTVIPPTSDPPGYSVTLTCKDASNIFLNPFEDHNSTATIRGDHLVFNLTEIALDYVSDRPVYSLNFENALDSDYLLLILEEDYSCRISSNRKSYLLNELEYGQVYTICLGSLNSTSVPPKNCGSVSVPRAYREQEWLLNKDKSLIIGLGCACMVIISLISGFLVFYVIRKYPTLIKSSKRVVVVKKKKPSVDVLIMPNYNSSRAPTAEIPPPSPSVVSSRSDGYMTPQAAFKLPENHGGLYDSAPSYCYCKPLATCRFHQTQGSRPTVTNSLYCNYKSENSDAPPLPPNHPKRKF